MPAPFPLPRHLSLDSGGLSQTLTSILIALIPQSRNVAALARAPFDS